MQKATLSGQPLCTLVLDWQDRSSGAEVIRLQDFWPAMTKAKNAPTLSTLAPTLSKEHEK